MNSGCQICGEGTLTECQQVNQDTIFGVDVPIQMTYSVCSSCGSEQVDSEQLKWNREQMLLGRLRVKVGGNTLGMATEVPPARQQYNYKSYRKLKNKMKTHSISGSIQLLRSGEYGSDRYLWEAIVKDIMDRWALYDVHVVDTSPFSTTKCAASEQSCPIATFCSVYYFVKEKENE